MRLLALLLVLPFVSASAQTGPASAAWNGGGPQGDTGAAVATDVEGNVAVVGTFKGTAAFGTATVTDPATGCVLSSCHDAYVVVYAPDGSVRWARRMGTPVHNDLAEGVAFGPDGSVYVSGDFTGVATWEGGSNPDIELTTRSNWDAFLARYTADGDLLWVARNGGADQDVGRGLAVDAEGNAYTTGYFYGTATFGEGADAVTFTSDGSSDGYVAKTRPDGTLAWAVQLGGVNGADFYDVTTSSFPTIEVVAVGTFSGVGILGTAALQSRGGNDIIVASLDPADGSVRWAQQIGGSESDHGRGIDIGFREEVYVAGWFNGQILVGSDVLTSAGQSDALLASLGPDGTPLWGRRAGGPGQDIAEAVAANRYVVAVRGDLPFTPSVLVSGYVDGSVTFGNPEGDVSLSAQGKDGFVAAYGEEEQLLRAALLQGGPGQDETNGIAITPSFQSAPPAPGDLLSTYAVAVGTFTGTASVFDEEVVTNGSSDVFVGKVTSCPAFYCVETAEESDPVEAGLAIRIAPHPATSSSRLTLSLDAPGDLLVEIVDALGRRVAQVADGLHAAGDHTVSLPRLAPGVYVVRASSSAGTVSRTMIVGR